MPAFKVTTAQTVYYTYTVDADSVEEAVADIESSAGRARWSLTCVEEGGGDDEGVIAVDGKERW